MKKFLCVLTLIAATAAIGLAAFLVTSPGRVDEAEATFIEGAFSQVSAGRYHNCAVKSDRTLVCWGFNSHGQSTPPEGTFMQVSGGQYHTCGVRTDGTLACWGANSQGQSIPPAGTFTQVSGGSHHTPETPDIRIYV